MFDNVADCDYAIPSYWDNGNVYRRLIKIVAMDEQIDVIDAVVKVYHSIVSLKSMIITDAFIMNNPNYIFECYKQNKML